MAVRGSALIIGGGVAGWAAARALAGAGVGVTLVEEEAPSRPSRALSLWTNGRTALGRLIGAEAAEKVPTSLLDLVEVRSFAGDLLWTFPIGPWSGPRSARSVWHDDLLNAVKRGAAITTKQGRLWRAVDDGTRVRAVLAATKETPAGEELAADILIGADGPHSTVRELLLGAERSHDLGQEMTCGLVAAARLKKSCGAGQLLGPGRAFACQSADARFIATRLDDRVSWMATTRIGRPLDEAFARAMPAVTEVIAATREQVAEEKAKAEQAAAEQAKEAARVAARREASLESNVTPTAEAEPARPVAQWVDPLRPFRLHDRPAAAFWVRGGIGLLGESAHPMTPELGQGGCLALEDAVVLGEMVQLHGLRPGLAAYERVRRARVDWIVALAHSMAVTSLPGDRRLAAVRDRLLPLAAPPLARAVFDRLVAWP